MAPQAHETREPWHSAHWRAHSTARTEHGGAGSDYPSGGDSTARPPDGV